MLDVSVFYIFGSLKEMGFNGSEGMDVLERWGQADKEQKLLSSLSLYTLPGEGVSQS